MLPSLARTVRSGANGNCWRQSSQRDECRSAFSVPAFPSDRNVYGPDGSHLALFDDQQ
jgi:hypothetical protein